MTFQFVPVSLKTFDKSPLTSKEREDAFFEQDLKVESLLLNPACPIHLSKEKLTQPSSDSRQGRRFSDGEREDPPRPSNPFMIFLNNYGEGRRKIIPGENIKNISILAKEEWNKSDPSVHFLFEELADLAKKYFQYVFPNYKYRPGRNRRSGRNKPNRNGRSRNITSSPRSRMSTPTLTSPSQSEISQMPTPTLTSPSSTSPSTTSTSPSSDMSTPPSIILGSFINNLYENPLYDFILFDETGISETVEIFPEESNCLQPFNLPVTSVSSNDTVNFEVPAEFNLPVTSVSSNDTVNFEVPAEFNLPVTSVSSKDTVNFEIPAEFNLPVTSVLMNILDTVNSEIHTEFNLPVTSVLLNDDISDHTKDNFYENHQLSTPATNNNNIDMEFETSVPITEQHIILSNYENMNMYSENTEPHLIMNSNDITSQYQFLEDENNESYLDESNLIHLFQQTY
ncbi:hypothetical protein Glove_306g56 [Diversispora epigaea]|uniref:HMG box domain-containing protein n=1 Tax=Diversispora epigaea TaxID=1348612 RepID=A0A397HZL2_9GLOM|nr:hypothetical protein Glove_306g56 [Diversispora epigaea]